MSKNLENEYRKMIEQDMPDLWSRIEMELPSKKKTYIFGFRRPTIHVVAGVAAAAMIVCVALPMMKMESKQSEKGKTSMNQTDWVKHSEASNFDSEKEEAIAEESEEVPIKEPSRKLPDEVHFADEAKEDSAMLLDESIPEEESRVEESIEVENENENKETANDSVEGDGEEELFTLDVAMAHEDVAVSVTGVKTVNGEKVYTAKVLEDTVSGLLEGDELFLKGDNVGEELKEGTEYFVSFASETSVSASEVSGNEAYVYRIHRVK